jgi:hypothetical protein
MDITSIESLRALYASPKERTLRKQLDALDRHCVRYIGLSPFLVLATVGADGRLDASPRGGPPGFVQVVDAKTLLIPDSPGNNRLDSLTNIVSTAQVGLLFLVPGVDETLRVNGAAVLSTALDELARCADERRTPKVAIRVTVREAYLHCAKAFMRSELWDPDRRVVRSALPTMGEMLREQTGSDGPAETQEEMLRRYAADL